MQAIQVLYGAGAAMRMQTDKAILEQFERLPGLPSARIGLNTAVGKDEEFGFEDFLGGLFNVLCTSVTNNTFLFSPENKIRSRKRHDTGYP